jgi:hypothetical protein
VKETSLYGSGIGVHSSGGCSLRFLTAECPVCLVLNPNSPSNHLKLESLKVIKSFVFLFTFTDDLQECG